jgi:hypothetical protein
LLDGVKCGLFKNDYAPTTLTALADLNPADFHGYALSAALVWGVPYYDQSGVATVVSGDQQFTATTPLAGPQIIYGYYIVDGAGAVLIAAARFDTPVNIIIVGNAVVVVPTIQLQSQAG